MNHVRIRRRRRGSSVLEVVLAATLFLAVASVATAATLNASAAQISSAHFDAVVDELTRHLDTVATTGFGVLAADTWAVPSPCDGSGPTGADGFSCVTVDGEPVTVEWDVAFDEDPSGRAVDTKGDATVTASAITPSGVAAASRVVPAPAGSFSPGDGLVRARFAGPYAETTGVAYLIDVNGDAVGSGPISDGGLALLAAPLSACTAADPCRVGISPGPDWTRDGTVAVSAASAFGVGGAVSFDGESIVGVGVVVYQPGSATLGLEAHADDGRVGVADASGSVCLWGAFHDGVADRVAVFCNSAQPGVVIFDTYKIGSTTFPLPTGIPITVTVDHPSGSCPAVDGQQGATLTGWVGAAVCTSWTWGVPTSFETPTGTVAFSEAELTLSELTVTHGTVIWEGAVSRPAVNYDPLPTWATPRAVPACAATDSCVSLGSTIPEDTSCPGELCFSVHSPRLTAPAIGGQFSVFVADPPTATLAMGSCPLSVGTNGCGVEPFSLTIDDPGGGIVTVTFDAVPGNGMIATSGYSPYAVNDTFDVDVTSGPVTVDLTFIYDVDDWPETVDLDLFSVTLTNNATVSVPYTIGLFNNDQRAWQLSGQPVSVGQNGTTVISVLAVGPSGLPVASHTLSASSTLVIDATSNTNIDGIAQFTVTPGVVAAGDYPVTLTSADGAQVELMVTVTQVGGSLTGVASATTIGQAASTTLTVTTLDLFGDPFGGVIVRVGAVDASGRTSGVISQPRGCITDAAGECTTTMIAGMAAAVGDATVTVSSGVFSSQTTITISPTVTNVVAQPLIVVAGGGGTVLVTVTDGEGTPMSGVGVVGSGPDAGLTLGVDSGTTNTFGQVELTVSVAGGTPAGTLEFTVTAAGTVAELAYVGVVGP